MSSSHSHCGRLLKYRPSSAVSYATQRVRLLHIHRPEQALLSRSISPNNSSQLRQGFSLPSVWTIATTDRRDGLRHYGQSLRQFSNCGDVIKTHRRWLSIVRYIGPGPRQARNGTNNRPTGHIKNRRAREATLSPSKALIEALVDAGYHSAVPQDSLLRTPKRDLSYSNPWARSINPDYSRKEAPQQRRPPKESLALITAYHIRHVYSVLSADQSDNLNQAIKETYTSEVYSYLLNQGYTASDVHNWSWVITSSTDDQAASRLAALARSDGEVTTRIPIFVLLFILRRSRFTAQSLRLLLGEAWRHSTTRGKDLDNATRMILIVRLLRYARQVWPESMTSIIGLLPTELGKQRNSTNSLVRLYNRVLSLLSVPASRNPFLSVVHQQRAQFAVLRKMAQFKPALTVTKEGYRAVTRLQVVHRKTASERQWAGYKANSWPPWKEDKLGIDAERGNEGKSSRAFEAMNRMMEAGIADEDWESMIKIYAGWDTDGSPTIQRRISVPRPSPSTRKEDVEMHRIWAARVRATRTRREAWACFLAYKDVTVRPHEEVYSAMFEKILLEPVATESSAGDGLEPLPEPISPNDVTYVRSPIPSADDLFKMMLSDGVSPSKPPMLALLLKRAPNLETGLSFLYEASWPIEILRSFLSTSLEHEDTRETLTSLDDHAFASFVALLCKPPSRDFIDPRSFFAHREAECPETRRLFEDFLDQVRTGHIDPLNHARDLLFKYLPSYPPCWNNLLSAIASSQPRSRFHRQLIGGRWKHMSPILQTMRDSEIASSFGTFHVICVGLQKELLSAFAENGPPNAREQLEDFFPEALEETKQFFDGLVGSIAPAFSQESTSYHSSQEAEIPDLPPLLNIPAPAHLHLFFRVLGICGDYDGIMSLLNWMERFQAPLQAHANELNNSAKMMRRTMVAVRLGLERSWGRPKLNDKPWANESFVHGAEEDVLIDAFDLVESMEGWGGWATDEEVEAYNSEGRRDKTLTQDTH